MKVIRDKITGRFKGSIGVGKNKIPQAAHPVVAPLSVTRNLLNKNGEPLDIIVDRTKIPPAKPLTNNISVTRPGKQAKTAEDYLVKYTEGECYELAYHIHKLNPKRYSLIELSTEESIGRIGAHWLVQDQQTAQYIDITGKALNPQDILTNFEDWEEWNQPQLRRITEKQFHHDIKRWYGDTTLPAQFQPFYGEWEDEAKGAVELFKLI